MCPTRGCSATTCHGSSRSDHAQTARKCKTSLKIFSAAPVAAAKAAAAPPAPPDGINWGHAIVTPGGGVAATVGALRKARGKNRNPTKEQVAVRFDPEVLAAFRADGPAGKLG